MDAKSPEMNRLGRLQTSNGQNWCLIHEMEHGSVVADVVLSPTLESGFRTVAPNSREGAGDSAAPLYRLPERLRAGLRLNSELVVNGATHPLLASEVSFGRLYRNVPEQELNLVEFSAGKVA